MGKSIKISTDNCSFKYRVSGLLINEGKILTTNMDNSGYLCLPGGHIDFGEDSKEAIIREMNEEVKYKIEIGNCIAIIENFFVNKKGITMHEVAFYYLFNISKDNKELIEDYKVFETDEERTVKHEFRWIDLHNINNIDFRPPILKDKLSKLDFDFEHIIYRENSKKI